MEHHLQQKEEEFKVNGRSQCMVIQRARAVDLLFAVMKGAGDILSATCGASCGVNSRLFHHCLPEMIARK